MGSGSNPTVNQTSGPAAWMQPYLQQYGPQLLGTMSNYASNMPVYTGNRVAPLSADQQNAANATEQWVLGQGNGFVPGMINQWNSTLSGQNTQAAQANPYTGYANPFGGMNSPYFEQQLQQGLQDIGSQYQHTIAPQLSSAQARAGAFGGSGADEANAYAQRQLADSMARYTTGMQQNQYNNSANLAAQDVARNSQLAQDQINLGNQNYENERQRQIATMGMFPGMNQSALQNLQSLMGVGDLQQQNANQNLQQQYQQWYDQAFGPAQGSNMLSSMLGSLAGTGSQTSATSIPGYSTAGTLAGIGTLGAGLGSAYGLFNPSGSGK